MLNTEQVQVYIDIDSNLGMVKSLMGKNIIPDKQYDIFFVVDSYIGHDLENYRIIQLNGKYELEVIDQQREQQKKIELNFEKSPKQLQEEYEKKLEELKALEELLK
ncbi:hypothetical protein [Priestia taiwanensis]|uniref:Uncharacterized protein n=1 Tax=Priestia taiwanensis TaxID=1347902 RepID=A0A917APF6_9BACI|nr:hypothetical protein [Priestia taiwanensis]MBM7362702.1 hypothetical protein [Priestia taiwanensis]GGE64377.1 hypothetical protein GCM10007140_13250 [Priestia taiwanensis]